MIIDIEVKVMKQAKINVLKPHISLNVKSVEKSAEFYKKLFGVDPVKFIKAETEVHSIISDLEGKDTRAKRFGYAKFDLESPALNLVLNEIPYKDGGALSHLGIQVASTDDVLTMKQNWIDRGLMTVDEMQVACCYAKQDKTWARDPDGNEWEVFVVLENLAPETGSSCECGDKVSTHGEASALNTESCCTPSPVGITSASTPKHETCCEAN